MRKVDTKRACLKEKYSDRHDHATQRDPWTQPCPNNRTLVKHLPEKTCLRVIGHHLWPHLPNKGGRADEEEHDDQERVEIEKG